MGGEDVNKEVEKIIVEMKEALSGKPLMFSQVLDLFAEEPYRDVLAGWGQLREDGLLSRTKEGLYYIYQ